MSIVRCEFHNSYQKQQNAQWPGEEHKRAVIEMNVREKYKNLKTQVSQKFF